MGFPRQGYWSGFPFPSPGDLHDPRIEPTSPVLAAEFFSNEPPGKPQHYLDDAKIQRTWNIIIENLYKLVTIQIPTLPPKSILE